MTTIEEIERAIDTLTPEQFSQLRRWMDEYTSPQPIDLHLESDLQAGLMDQLIDNAVADHKAGRTQPL